MQHNFNGLSDQAHVGKAHGYVHAYISSKFRTQYQILVIPYVLSLANDEFKIVGFYFLFLKLTCKIVQTWAQNKLYFFAISCLCALTNL